MTDQQLLDLFLKRAAKAGKSYNATLKDPRVVITQQYGKKLYFAVKFDGALSPFWINFTKAGWSKIFSFPELLPEKLIGWKRDIIRKMTTASPSNYSNKYVGFDLKTMPKEVAHIFFGSLISALDTPGMSIGFQTNGCQDIFGPNETYEEVSVEADLDAFNQDNPWIG